MCNTSILFYGRTKSRLAAGNEMAPMQLGTELMTMTSDFGAPMGYEFIDEKKVGSSIVRLRYLLKFEGQPVIWQLYYYRADEMWDLNSVDLEEDLAILMP